MPVGLPCGYDPALGRFAQADTIIPAQSQGVQAWDRYAGMNNNPVRYSDPSGHRVCEDDETCDGNGNKIPAAKSQKKTGKASPSPSLNDAHKEKVKDEQDVIFQEVMTVEELEKLYLALSDLHEYLLWGMIGTSVLGAVATTIASIGVTPIAGIAIATVFSLEVAAYIVEMDRVSGLMSYVNDAIIAAKSNSGAIQMTVFRQGDSMVSQVFPTVHYAGASRSYTVTSLATGLLFSTPAGLQQFSNSGGH
jgi:hypothetical protein